MQQKPSTIYVITCSVNGKIYIGRTRIDIQKRLRQHKWRALRKTDTLLGRAMIKHGPEQFTIRSLETVASAQASAREAELIAQHDATNRCVGYNLAAGGCGSDGAVGMPTRAKLSAVSKAYWAGIPPEDRSTMMRERMAGVPKSDDHCRSISRTRAGVAGQVKSSRYVGVRAHYGKWEATCYHQGRAHGRSGLATEEEAAQYYDKLSLALRGPAAPINFEHLRGHYLTTDLTAVAIRQPEKTSRYRHVSYNTKRKTWCVFIGRKYHGERKSELAAVELAVSILGLPSAAELLKPSRRKIPRPRAATV